MAVNRRPNLALSGLRDSFYFETFGASYPAPRLLTAQCMLQPSVSISPESAPYVPYGNQHEPKTNSLANVGIDATLGIFNGLLRRVRRERRRRKVGRAYDMALEVARVIPPNSCVLDVGCGNGFIAHHLSAMLGSRVTGIDLDETTSAPINYRAFDGTNFPADDQSFDAALLCYVLHHAQNLSIVLNELRRVLSDGGLAVIYEDIPETWWDRLVCSIHDRKWRNRTGPCNFQSEQEWRATFNSAGFDVVCERRLSRWRNIAHPVCRRFFLLKRISQSAR